MASSENFNSGSDGAYKAYYKPKAPPGGVSQICFGGPEPVKEANKENAGSRPGSGKSDKSDSAVAEKQGAPAPQKAEPILPKSNNVLGGETQYPKGGADIGQGGRARPSTKVCKPPGGASSITFG